MSKKHAARGDRVNFSVILAVSTFFIILFVELVLIGNSNFVNNRIFSERIENDLTTIAELNSRHAGILLGEQREKLKILADTELIESELEAIVKGEDVQESLDRLSSELIEIHHNDDEDFQEVYVIDLSGTIVSSSNPNSISKIVPVSIEFLTGEDDTGISGIYYSDILRKNVIDISAKVFTDEDRHIGALVAVLTLKELSEIVSAEGLGETGESYVIDSEGFFITPSKSLKGENRGVLTQQINTKNSRECFIQQAAEEISEYPVFIDYLDYRGEKVFGTHALIPESEWCVIVTIDSNEVFESSRDIFLKNLIAIPLIILVVITLLAFSCGRFLDKKYMEGNRRKI